MTDTSDDVLDAAMRAFGDTEIIGGPPSFTKRAMANAIRAALEAARYGEPAWQLIETAPRDGRWVLVFNANRKANIVGMPLQPLPTVAYFDRNEWNDGTDPLLPPTHWMPLPEPPPALLSSIGASHE